MATMVVNDVAVVRDHEGTPTLAQAEAVIERAREVGRNALLDIGHQLQVIEQNELWKESGQPTFRKYVEDRWEYTERHARHMIAAADVVQQIEPGTIVPGITESHARELVRLRGEPKKLNAALRDADAEAKEKGVGRTAAMVKKAVAKYVPPKPKAERAAVAEVVPPPRATGKPEGNERAEQAETLCKELWGRLAAVDELLATMQPHYTGQAQEQITRARAAIEEEARPQYEEASSETANEARRQETLFRYMFSAWWAANGETRARFMECLDASKSKREKGMTTDQIREQKLTLVEKFRHLYSIATPIERSGILAWIEECKKHR